MSSVGRPPSTPPQSQQSLIPPDQLLKNAFQILQGGSQTPTQQGSPSVFQQAGLTPQDLQMAEYIYQGNPIETSRYLSDQLALNPFGGLESGNDPNDMFGLGGLLKQISPDDAVALAMYIAGTPTGQAPGGAPTGSDSKANLLGTISPQDAINLAMGIANLGPSQTSPAEPPPEAPEA